jgi:hypothetical protein
MWVGTILLNEGLVRIKKQRNDEGSLSWNWDILLLLFDLGIPGSLIFGL